MRQIIDEPPAKMRTIHVWMVPEPEQPEPEERWPKWAGDLCMQVVALAMLAGFVFFPGEPIYKIVNITVPAILLPVQTIPASAEIIATGVRTIPAREAHGTLTIYNGSALVESLPAGFIVSTSRGVEIATDQAVTIPAANAPTFGMAQVAAHAVQTGAAGNIEAGAIHQQDGSSLVIKNLAAFTGGQDASTVRYTTSQDKNNAIAEARSQVENKQLTDSHPGELLAGCAEATKVEADSAAVTWSCQYATFAAPAGAQVLSARMSGKSVVLRVKEMVLPQ